MNDTVKKLRVLGAKSRVHKFSQPRQQTRRERYLCTNCQSMIPGTKTVLQYTPVEARLCSYCGHPVIKRISKAARRFIRDLESAGYEGVKVQ